LEQYPVAARDVNQLASKSPACPPILCRGVLANSELALRRVANTELDYSQAFGIEVNASGRTIMTSSQLSLRLARPADAAVIADLSRDLIEYGLQWRWTPMRVAASIRAPNVNVLVASVDDTIAGFAIMRYGDDDAHLDLLAVTPTHRRTGVGRRLVEWLEKCAVVAGIFKISLEVRAGNEAAQLFYKQLGYRALTSVPGYYQGIEAALRMARDLSCASSGRQKPGGMIDLHPAFRAPLLGFQTLRSSRSTIQRFRE
jgi:ribosomal-protein-alanine N-acetyltransferase